MPRRLLAEKVLWVEILGLFVIAAMPWLNEILDVPHFLFGTEATPINWSESLLESVLVMVLGVGIVTGTGRVLSHIRHLEGFLRMCGRCKRVHVGRRWVPIEDFLAREAPVTIADALCEHCLQEGREDDQGKPSASDG